MASHCSNIGLNTPGRCVTKEIWMAEIKLFRGVRYELFGGIINFVELLYWFAGRGMHQAWKLMCQFSWERYSESADIPKPDEGDVGIPWVQMV